MATSRRGKKPKLTRARTGPNLEESGSYTVETRERQPSAPEPGPVSGVAGVLEALAGAGQIGIYRLQPQWARGHLQTLSLAGGESLDFEMLDQLQRYWGGGTYQFRPMKRGRFAGSSQSIQFDGPTLFQGRPHPKDPAAQREVVRAEVVPNHFSQHQAHHAHHAQPFMDGPPQRAPQYPSATASPELQMFGNLVDRIMTRMDSIEARLAGPMPPPSQAPDQMAGVLNTLKIAKQINEFMNPVYDEPDDEDEPEEWTPKNPQEAMLALALRKMDDDPDMLDKFLGNKTAAQPQRPANAPGPRLVRAEEQTASSQHNKVTLQGTRPQADQNQSGKISPDQILAQLQSMSPQDRAMLVNQIGEQLDPETLAALSQMMGGQSAAG